MWSALYSLCLKRQTGNHLARSSLLWAFWPWPPFCRTWSWRLCHSWAWRTVWGWWCVQGSPVGYTPRTGYLCIMSLAPHLKTINIHVHAWTVVRVSNMAYGSFVRLVLTVFVYKWRKCIRYFVVWTLIQMALPQRSKVPDDRKCSP